MGAFATTKLQNNLHPYFQIDLTMTRQGTGRCLLKNPILKGLFKKIIIMVTIKTNIVMKQLIIKIK